MLTRPEAWNLLREHVKETSLLKHCVAVEITMRAYANQFGEDENYWGILGLLHDVDYEKYPDDHPNHAAEILSGYGFDNQFVLDIESHGSRFLGERSRIQKVLHAVDALTGFVIACALVRPDKSLDHLEVKSMVKKYKDKAFARAVDREELKEGAEALEVDFKQHMDFVRAALASAVKQPEYQEFPLVG